MRSPEILLKATQSVALLGYDDGCFHNGGGDIATDHENRDRMTIACK